LALGHARAGILAGAALALAVYAYRRGTGAATFFEAATASVLGAAALATLAGAPTSGPVLAASFAALAAIWAAAAGLRPLGLTGEYARWEYLPALAGTALFRHPNVFLSLLWAGAFLANAALALWPIAGGGRALGVVLHACILAACAAITGRRKRGASTRRIDDVDRRLAEMRSLAAGVAVVGVGVLALAIAR
ncbi:MAG TPA: hypothetical protein VFK90_08065, partial [Anaeromyxobacter sp.]|nr:hypothetical protein [Anaeromyxobacter sp.]